jgi:sec-independent protein translocase protein TatC
VARKKNPEARMSLGGHLKELRKRLFWSALFITGGAVGGWFFYDPFFTVLKSPLDKFAASDPRISVNFPDVMSAFDLRLQVSIFLGLLVTSPVWLYHLWAFITPALRKRERRYTLAFLLTSVPLFSAGAWLAWVSLPTFMSTLLAFTPEGATNIINAKDYILFNLRILLVFGLAFVMPVILVILNLAGLITAKSIFKSWRLALFLIAVISAVATPTADPLSMFVLMVPLSLLYFASGAVAFVTDRRRLKRAKAIDEELEG